MDPERWSRIERVLRIKHLLFVEGLTLAGVRRKLTEEGEDPRAEKDSLQDVAALFGVDARERILQVKRGLREIASMLSRRPAGSGNGPFELKAEPARPSRSAPAPPAKAAAQPSPHKKGKKKRK